MSKTALKGADHNAKKQIRKKSKKKELRAKSLGRLAGGWSQKEADEFFDSIEPFDQISKPSSK